MGIPHSTLSNTVMSPPETSAGTGRPHSVPHLQQEQPRVVVERLDSLGTQHCESDSVLCSDDGSGTIRAPSFPVLSLTQQQQQQQHTLTSSPALTSSPSLSLNLSSVAVEEETYSRLGIHLENVTFELCDTLDSAPSSEAQDILNSYLADTDMMAMAAQEEDKWTQSLVDLFPDLD